MRRPVTVSVPASSANLGPGFDSFGLALSLRNTFTAELSDDWSVEVVGEGEGRLPSGAENQVARAMARVFAEAGRPATAAHVRCENRIPPGAGLGSSAAAVVGGLLLGDALVDAGLDDDAVLALAAGLEGHPDNAAAALHGGLTICWTDGTWRCVRVEPACGLAAVVVGASQPLSTDVSRELLPDSVPHSDAAFCAGRAGLLVAGVALGDGVALAAGLADRIHEPYRRPVVPDLDAIRDALIAAGASGAVLSGAGPTVIGLVAGADDADALARAQVVATTARGALERADGRLAPVALGIERSGAKIL